jgi:pimeloyl-ACP methyl ester carboxylesterase
LTSAFLTLLLLADSARGFSIPVAPAESVHVTVVGTGDPVVLVPGLFGSAYGFRHVIPVLTAAGYRAIVIEPLGIGTSGRPEHADYSLTAQASRLAAALDSLRVRHAIVVAHSVGAAMAFRLAYRRPDLVRGLVSLDGGPAEAAATPGFRRAMRFAPWIKLFGGIRLVRGKIRKALIAASGDSGWVTDSVVAAYTAGAAANLDGTLRAYLRMARAHEPERLEPHLGHIRCPVRLSLGTAPHSSGIRQREIDLLGRTVTSFAIDTVVGAGHYIHEEQPAAVGAAVRRLDATARLTVP